MLSTQVQQAIASPPKFIPTLSEDQAKQQSRLLKALSDPTRLRILSLLSEHGGEMSVTDIVACFSLAQPSTSHHLSILRAAGLIDCRKSHTWNYYFVKQSKLNEAWQSIQDLEPSVTIE